MIGHALDKDFAAAAKEVVWMPSHGAAHAIGVLRDSNGARLTPVMWRANRLADLLAKSAAEPTRLPARVRKQVADVSKLYMHHCARLGVATSRANSHRITFIDGQGMERTSVIRDSTAERPDWKLRKRRAAAAAERQHPGDPGGARIPASLPRFDEGETAEVSRSSRCKRKSIAAQNPTAAKRAKVNAIEALRQDARDEQQLSAWVESYAARPSTGPPAAERMAALQMRVRARAKQRQEDLDLYC